nr:alpha/beta hydrolase [Burkholderia ambifaria]
MHGDARTLFLHGGPGGSALAERAMYGRSLPIHWWDQPRSVALYPRPFGALAGAAEAELRLVAQRSGAPVDVVAHAFGAQLALDLAARMPDRLGRLVLLAPIGDLGAAFVRLASAVVAHEHGEARLSAAMQSFLARPDFARFACLVDEIERVPAGAALLRGSAPGARPDTRAAAFDRQVFDAVVADAWPTSPRLPRVGVAGGVRVIFGDRDPLLDIDTEIRRWTAWCPAACVRVVPSGHFVQLETPATVWWSPAGG